MATLAPPPSTAGLYVDLTKQAEYPILLGEKLAGKSKKDDDYQLISVTYNHKSKSTLPQQRAVITPSSSSSSSTSDMYDLTITGNAEHMSGPLEYKYTGSVDPSLPEQLSETQNLVLIFDPARKAFVLEPVSTNLHFNLRSAPGQSKHVIEQYEQLRTIADGNAGGDDLFSAGEEDDNNEDDDNTPEAADPDNPYDFRHFLAKQQEDEKDKKKKTGLSVSACTTPDPHSLSGASRVNTPSLPPRSAPAAATTTSAAAKPKPKQTKAKPSQSDAAPRPAKKQAQPKVEAKPLPPSKSKPRGDQESDVSPVDHDSKKKKEAAAPSPAGSSSNIIVDGDLIIDMGSPPPTRPAFKINPAHFSSSNNTSANEADDDENEEEGEEEEEEIEDFRLPSPAAKPPEPQTNTAGVNDNNNDNPEEDDEFDPLAAEMEAAFEEEAKQQQQQQQLQQQYRVEGSEESEVSEEE